MLLTRPGWRLDEYREPDGSVKLEHLRCQFVGIVLGEARFCLIIEGRVEVAEWVAEMMSHCVQVQVNAEASRFPKVEQNLPALLDWLGIGNFEIIIFFERIVLERFIGDPTGVSERIEVWLAGYSESCESTTEPLSTICK